MGTWNKTEKMKKRIVMHNVLTQYDPRRTNRNSKKGWVKYMYLFIQIHIFDPILQEKKTTQKHEKLCIKQQLPTGTESARS